MPPAIDPDMVLMMNAKEGQPAYWRNGENGLAFVQWAAPVQTPDSRLQSAKDRLVVKVVHIKNCEERLARMEEQLQQCTAEKTAVAEQLQAVQEQRQRDVDTFQAEKASLHSRIDAMQRQTTGTSRNVGGQASGLRFGQDSGRVALGVHKPFAPPAAKSRAFSSYPRVVGNGFVYQS
jgi:hypothetical protein